MGLLHETVRGCRLRTYSGPLQGKTPKGISETSERHHVFGCETTMPGKVCSRDLRDAVGVNTCIYACMRLLRRFRNVSGRGHGPVAGACMQ